MSIRSYFKSVSSFPTSEETRIGAVATRETNRSVQRVFDEQRSKQPPSRQLIYTFSADDQCAKVGKYAE